MGCKRLVSSQRWLPAFTLFLLSLFLPQAYGMETPPAPQENLKLHSFKIEGNKLIKTAEIKKELSEKRPSLWTFWKGEPAFRRADLDYDVDRLKIPFSPESECQAAATGRLSGGGKPQRPGLPGRHPPGPHH